MSRVCNPKTSENKSERQKNAGLVVCNEMAQRGGRDQISGFPSRRFARLSSTIYICCYPIRGNNVQSGEQ